MSTSLEDVVERVREGIKAFTGRFIKKQLTWSEPYPVGLRVKALLEIRAQRWEKLTALAEEYRNDSLKDLKEIKEHQEHWRTLTLDIQRLQKRAEKNWQRPMDNDTWPTVAERIRKKLQSKGLSASKIEQGIKRFSTAQVDDVFVVFRTPLKMSAKELETAALMRLSALAGIDIADEVARFNILVESGGMSKPTSTAVSGAHSKMLGGLRELQSALRNKSAKQIQRECDRLHRIVELQRVPIRLAAAYWERVSAANGSVVDARKALSACDAMRLLILAASVARLAAWSAGWGDDSDTLAEWRAAANKGFASVFKEAKPTQLSKVIGSPSFFDKKVITLEGKVGPVVIRHLGEKVVSSTSLVDSDGAVVAIGLTHIKIDSGGLVPGAYASLTGTFAATSSEFPGPTLVLGRRVLTQDSQRSWYDWVQLKLLPIVTPIPHGLTGRWSWKAGPDGPGNLLQYGTWAESRRFF